MAALLTSRMKSSILRNGVLAGILASSIVGVSAFVYNSVVFIPHLKERITNQSEAAAIDHFVQADLTPTTFAAIGIIVLSSAITGFVMTQINNQRTPFYENVRGE